MTHQIAVKLPEETLTAVDKLVSTGRYASRSQAVRAGLDLIVRASREDAIDRAFIEGFSHTPDTAEELRTATRLAVQAIEDEPWEKWW